MSIVWTEGNIVQFDDEKYGEIDLYYPSEDWMGMQLDYTRYDEAKGDDATYGRRFGVGGIELVQDTPNATRVQIRDMDAEGAEHDLFYWYSSQDQTEYPTDGDVEMSSEFAWELCHMIERFYEDKNR